MGTWVSVSALNLVTFAWDYWRKHKCKKSSALSDQYKEITRDYYIKHPEEKPCKKRERLRIIFRQDGSYEYVEGVYDRLAGSIHIRKMSLYEEGWEAGRLEIFQGKQYGGCSQ